MHSHPVEKVAILQRRHAQKQAAQILLRLPVRRGVHAGRSVPNHYVAADQRRPEGTECGRVRVRSHRLGQDAHNAGAQSKKGGHAVVFRWPTEDIHLFGRRPDGQGYR